MLRVQIQNACLGRQMDVLMILNEHSSISMCCCKALPLERSQQEVQALNQRCSIPTQELQVVMECTFPWIILRLWQVLKQKWNHVHIRFRLWGFLAPEKKTRRKWPSLAPISVWKWNNIKLCYDVMPFTQRYSETIPPGVLLCPCPPCSLASQNGDFPAPGEMEAHHSFPNGWLLSPKNSLHMPTLFSTSRFLGLNCELEI